MRKVFSSSDPIRLSISHQCRFTRQFDECHIVSRDIIDFRSVHKIYCKFQGWFGGSLLVGPGFRSSSLPFAV